MQRLLIVVPMKKVFWVMVAALVIASGAWAQGTVTRGPLVFTFNGDIAGPQLAMPICSGTASTSSISSGSGTDALTIRSRLPSPFPISKCTIRQTL